MTATLERTLAPFKNETIKNFTDPADIAAMQAALEYVKGHFGKTYPIIIDGQPHKTEKHITSINPADPNQIIGVVGSASLEQANSAIELAAKRFETWKKTSAQERAGYLLKAAALIRQRRFEFNAWLVYEVGKSWPEADGDTAETIDFLEYYAREALRYDGPQPVEPFEGEQNELTYIPLGVG
ncbi:MAG: aldehyde dehydrogenase family protein, partial [Candidatus Eremiobacteraeota bacterium]|nr:aldehyde dehydrogenase family protein [Candidatus Eremiobacteraeota bacterium]